MNFVSWGVGMGGGLGGSQDRPQAIGPKLKPWVYNLLCVDCEISLVPVFSSAKIEIKIALISKGCLKV